MAGGFEQGGQGFAIQGPISYARPDMNGGRFSSSTMKSEGVGSQLMKGAELNPQAEANRAAMDVANKGSRQMASDNRRLRSMGVNASSGTSQAVNKNARIALAAAKAGAANRGRRATTRENFNRQIQAAKVMQGDRSQDMQAESMSMQADDNAARLRLADAQFQDNKDRFKASLTQQMASEREASRYTATPKAKFSDFGKRTGGILNRPNSTVNKKSTFDV